MPKKATTKSATKKTTAKTTKKTTESSYKRVVKHPKKIWREGLDCKKYFAMLKEDAEMTEKLNRPYKLAPALSDEERSDFATWCSTKKKTLPCPIPTK